MKFRRCPGCRARVPAHERTCPECELVSRPTRAATNGRGAGEVDYFGAFFASFLMLAPLLYLMAFGLGRLFDMLGIRWGLVALLLALPAAVLVLVPVGALASLITPYVQKVLWLLLDRYEDGTPVWWQMEGPLVWRVVLWLLVWLCLPLILGALVAWVLYMGANY